MRVSGWVPSVVRNALPFRFVAVYRMTAQIAWYREGREGGREGRPFSFVCASLYLSVCEPGWVRDIKELTVFLLDTHH